MILQDSMASLNSLFTIGDQAAEPIRVHEGVRHAKDLLKAVRIPSPETRVTQYPHEIIRPLGLTEVDGRYGSSASAQRGILGPTS